MYDCFDESKPTNTLKRGKSEVTGQLMEGINEEEEEAEEYEEDDEMLFNDALADFDKE
jgi:hypothetical protein